MALAVPGSLTAPAAGAKNKAAHWKNTTLLTIQLREAHAID
jgi:hypothetical protein